MIPNNFNAELNFYLENSLPLSSFCDDTVQLKGQFPHLVLDPLACDLCKFSTYGTLVRTCIQQVYITVNRNDVDH